MRRLRRRRWPVGRTFLEIDKFKKATKTGDELAYQAGRSGGDIERSVTWRSADTIDTYIDAGATTIMTEIHPNPTDGFDFAILEEVLNWRDRQR